MAPAPARRVGAGPAGRGPPRAGSGPRTGLQHAVRLHRDVPAPDRRIPRQRPQTQRGGPRLTAPPGVVIQASDALQRRSRDNNA
ncbi:hypothetical protein G6F50_018200 [Rhizopus delemar]|uniref:Uncharacterized protein n=1 Tax=Rhizopus delemar TaxID=936053 RepID=A0A9P6XMX0_9FUNG|nr:hypothetical protein G6F50_018200 [Rhizopus delemar]